MQDHPSLSSTTSTSKPKPDSSFSIKEEAFKYLFYWKWILLSVIVCLIVAVMYLRYTTPKYSASTTILVKDERKGGLDSELAAFEDLGIGKGVKSNVDNETQIITSRTVMENAVKRLNLNVSYFTEGRVRITELYDSSPVLCTVYDTDGDFYSRRDQITLVGAGDASYELLNAAGKSLGKFRYGQIVGLKDCKISVNKNKGLYYPDYNVNVKFARLKDVVDSYRARVEAITPVRNSAVVQLSVSDPVSDRAEDLLDAIIQIYNEDAIADKNLVAQKTEDFIEQRLKLIAAELGDVERDAESYKKSNQIADITSQAGLYLENAVSYEKALIEIGTQISVTSAMHQFMQQLGAEELAPINIIPIENSSYALIAEYNQAIIAKGRLQQSATPENSAMINLTNRIAEMRVNIIESLSTQLDVLKIRQRDLQRQNSQITGKISEIPTQEREFRIIDRQQKIKESLYIYLLQKREEIAISLKVTPPNAKVIDLAQASESPISPKRSIIYAMALGIGLVIPLGIIYLLQLIDTKVRRRQDVEAGTDIPFLGNIPRLLNPERIIDNSERSGAAEAIRIVRTNLEFMLSGKTDSGARTIFVTSTLPKEGKTSIAVNLAATIALSGKKVLLMGLDIRNPKIQNYIKVPPAGFTNFISQEGGDIHAYISPVPNYDSLFVLPAGVIPPNPVELLLNDKVGKVFAELKASFDYLIVDTAPVSLVTDTMLISHQADATVYVLRANQFDKRMLPLVQSFYEEKKLRNMAVVLNDTVKGKTYGYGGYGYGDYGYGYSKEPEKPVSWWKRLFKKS